jgi:hypothetical protein
MGLHLVRNKSCDQSLNCIYTDAILTSHNSYHRILDLHLALAQFKPVTIISSLPDELRLFIYRPTGLKCCNQIDKDREGC